MPRQERPVVKDGRLQVKKKRTDRSYLQPTAQTVTTEPDTHVEPAAEPAAAGEPPVSVIAPPAVADQTATVAAARSATQRALEQQGVRKRREVDVNAVAKRDSAYAMHELRRIAILTTLVVVALVILTLTLR